MQIDHKTYDRNFKIIMSDIKKSNNTAKIIKTDFTYPYSADYDVLRGYWYSDPSALEQIRRILAKEPQSTKNITSDGVLNTHKPYYHNRVGDQRMKIVDALKQGLYDPRLDSLMHHFTMYDDPIQIGDNGAAHLVSAPRTDVKAYSENIFPKIQNKFNLKDARSPEYRFLASLGIYPENIMSLDENELQPDKVLEYYDINDNNKKWKFYPKELFNNYGQNTNQTMRTMVGEALEGFRSLPKSVQEAFGMMPYLAQTHYFTDNNGFHSSSGVYLQSPEQILSSISGARRGAHQNHELTGHELFDHIRGAYSGQDPKKIGMLSTNALSYPMINAMYKIYNDHYRGDRDALAGDLINGYLTKRRNNGGGKYSAGETKSLLDLLNMVNIVGRSSEIGNNAIENPDNFKLKNNAEYTASHKSTYFDQGFDPYTLVANEGFATTLGAMSPQGNAHKDLTTGIFKPLGRAAEEMGKEYVDYRKDHPDKK